MSEGHDERLSELAAELVRRQVAVIAAVGGNNAHSPPKQRPRTFPSSSLAAPSRYGFRSARFRPPRSGRIAERALARGLRAVKVKVGIDMATDLDRVAAVRSAAGESARVGVDANGGWNESDVLAAIPHLERLRVNVIEQPLRRGDFRGCAPLRQRTAIPIMLEESVFTRQETAEAIREDACDIISVYPRQERRDSALARDCA